MVNGQMRHSETRPNHPVQAVIFDLDGVLMNSEGVAFEVWQEIVSQYGGTLDDSAMPGMVGLSAEESALHAMRSAGITFDVEESCARSWRLLAERLGANIEPLPGAVELVRELARRGSALAVASNSPTHYIDNALAGMRLAPYFPIRVGIDEVAQGKPAPDVYLTAARRLGVSPARCLAIEDSPVGVQSAAAAGMRVIAVPTAHDGPDDFAKAWWVSESLIEVKNRIHQFLPPNGHD